MNEAILAFLALIIFGVLSGALFRLVDVKPVMLVLTVASMIACLSTGLFASLADIRGDFWTYAAFYSCAYLSFVQVFAVFYKSVSLRIIYDIRSTGKCSETKNNIYVHSILRGSFEQRLGGLEDAGLISREGFQVSLTTKGKRMVRRLNRLQRIFGITSSG